MLVSSRSIFSSTTSWRCYLCLKIITNSRCLVKYNCTTAGRKFEIYKEQRFIAESIENSFHYSILKSNAEYCNTIAFTRESKEKYAETSSILQKNFEVETVYTLKICLKTLLESQAEVQNLFEDDRFIKLCNTLISKVNDLNDEHLMDLLNVLILWPNEKHNDMFFEMCKAADGLCVLRFRAWGRDRCLLAMDHFYRLGVIRYSDFAWCCIRKICARIHRLPSRQLIQIMFFANVCRKWHPAINMYDVEVALEQNIDELSVEEIGIIAAAFFKTQTKVHNLELLDKMFQKLMFRLDVGPIKSITLSSFLKLFRFSASAKREHKIRELMKLLLPIIDDLPIMCCVHVALLGNTTLIFNPDLLKRVAKKLVTDVKKARLKDIERIILSLVTFDYDPATNPCVFQTAVNEIKRPERMEEILLYPKSYANLLASLSLRKIYDYDCANFALSKKFVTACCGKATKYTFSRDLFVLSNGLLIEEPSYSGHQLEPAFRSELADHFSWRIPVESDKKLTSNERLMLDVKKVLENTFKGPEYIHCCYVLPHHPRADIIFCIQRNSVVPIPSDMKSSTALDLVPPPNIGEWYCVLCTGMATVKLGTDQPVGVFVAKMRQLKALNYTPLVVNHMKWSNLKPEEQVEYLLSPIKQILQF